MSGFFSDLGSLIFFKILSDYLNHEAQYFLDQMLGNAYTLIGSALLAIMTLWIILHGYRIMSGQSREPLMGFIITTGKAFLIIGIATTWGANNGDWFRSITEGTSSTVHYIVTGDSSSDAFDGIDKNLALMQTGLGAIKAIDVGDSAELESEKTQALWMSGAGTAGPAIVAGTLLFVNKFAWALFMGFGPIFILCLLFEQTKQMFHTWLRFGLGLMTSLAVLSFMTEVAMRMVGAMTAATLARDFLGGSSAGFTQAAMQQGGLGLILTALLITVPNMASNFLGQFSSGFSGNNLWPKGNDSPAHKAPTKNEHNPPPLVNTDNKSNPAIDYSHDHSSHPKNSSTTSNQYAEPRINSDIGFAQPSNSISTPPGGAPAPTQPGSFAPDTPPKLRV